MTAVTMVGNFAVADGYGSMNEFLALGMHRSGARVSIAPMAFHPRGCSEEFLRLVARSRAHLDGHVLYSGPVHRAELKCLTDTSGTFARTMYEGAAIPGAWAAVLNETRGLVVPTTFVADMFRSCGVSAPIAVVPDGVDPDIYFYQRRPERAGLTTLIVGMMQSRKHFREGIAAWRLAFQDDPHARLILKGRGGKSGGYVPDDPRITLITANEPSRGIAHWYRRADVLLALGNEGFGLPLIEGMATGLPVIALDSEGQSDVCREAAGLVLSIKPKTWQPHPHGGRTHGFVGVPGVECVAAKLRWVRQHRDEAAEIGRAAAQWVHQHRNVWRYGPDVLAFMEERASRRRVSRFVPISSAATGWAR